MKGGGGIKDKRDDDSPDNRRLCQLNIEGKAAATLDVARLFRLITAAPIMAALYAHTGLMNHKTQH